MDRNLMKGELPLMTHLAAVYSQNSIWVNVVNRTGFTVFCKNGQTTVKNITFTKSFGNNWVINFDSTTINILGTELAIEKFYILYENGILRISPFVNNHSSIENKIYVGQIDNLSAL